MKDIDTDTASVKKLMGMAIRAEIDSNKIYTKIADKLKNPFLKEKFTLLAFEENKHRKILEKLYEIFFDTVDIKVPDKTDESLLPSIEIKSSSSFVEILQQAMNAEKAAEDFYQSLSEKVQNPQKKILIYLSKVEKSHYEILKSELVLAQEFEDYAEKDIDKVIT